jgi:hypothetical protein
MSKNLLFVWLALLTVGFAYLAWGRGTHRFEELTVHRLNVIEADGKPRLIISDGPHFPGAIFAGKEYRHPNREYGSASRGGVLFYNNEGDEAGGMLFDTGLQDGNRYANSSILLDQNGQDQAMGLQYGAWKGVHNAGLRVWDQPNESLMPLVELGDRAARAPTREQRETMLKELKEKGRKMGGFTERFYAGKQDGDALVKLADKNGKPRLLLKVGADGAASVEFLDAAGKVTKRITQ